MDAAQQRFEGKGVVRVKEGHRKGHADGRFHAEFAGKLLRVIGQNDLGGRALGDGHGQVDLAVVCDVPLDNPQARRRVKADMTGSDAAVQLGRNARFLPTGGGVLRPQIWAKTASHTEP